MAAGGAGYFATGFFHDGYWHDGYWAEAGAAPAVPTLWVDAGALIYQPRAASLVNQPNAPLIHQPNAGEVVGGTT